MRLLILISLLLFANALRAQDTTLTWFKSDTTSSRYPNGFYGCSVVTREINPPGSNALTCMESSTATALWLAYARDTFTVIHQIANMRPGRFKNDWYRDTIIYRIPAKPGRISCTRRYWVYRGNRNLDTLGTGLSGVLASELTKGSEYMIVHDTVSLNYAGQLSIIYTGKKRRWPQVRNKAQEGLSFTVYKFLPEKKERITAVYWVPEFGVIRVESPQMKEAYEFSPGNDDYTNIVNELNERLYNNRNF